MKVAGERKEYFSLSDAFRSLSDFFKDRMILQWYHFYYNARFYATNQKAGNVK